MPIKIFFLIAFFINFGLLQNVNGQVKLIKVIKTNFNIESDVSVHCDGFYNSFREIGLDTLSITDKSQQQKILKLIRSSKLAKEYRQPDTRARMFIYHVSGKIDSLCLSNTVIFSLNNNTMFLPNRDLIVMLERLKK